MRYKEKQQKQASRDSCREGTNHSRFIQCDSYHVKICTTQQVNDYLDQNPCLLCLETHLALQGWENLYPGVATSIFWFPPMTPPP